MRVYLAAFMIGYRPTHVFESMGCLEQALYEVAGPLTVNFQRIVECVIKVGAFQDVPADLTTGFIEMLFEFLKCFKAWKVPDEVILIITITY